MKLEHISKWIPKNEMKEIILDDEIKSWLLEEGPITKKIKSNHIFDLNLLNDSIGKINSSERSFLNNVVGEVKIREVILLADKKPLVFARSHIPKITIEKGLKKLGELGTKPLGDILFEKKLFIKNKTVFSTFSNENKDYWGRKTLYFINNLPLSVMEVFLINK